TCALPIFQTEKTDIPNLPLREHRLYQEAGLQQNVLSIVLRHRFRHEQRFINQQDMRTRFRYLIAADIPIIKKEEIGLQLYATFYNEIFINGEKYTLQNDTYFRSEEHTSELQSRENLVCRLLLEKKNHKD